MIVKSAGFALGAILSLCLVACAPLSEDDTRAQAHRISIRHPGFASDEAHSYTLNQINDAEGFPAEYSMRVDSVICPEGTCQIIAVDMTWDALGRYLRYELPPGKFLEKGQVAQQRDSAEASLPFSTDDHHKLHAILQDGSSLLGQQRLPEVVRLSISGDVDCITGATPASVQDAVVSGASLTCYNLWHWANGEVPQKIRELTQRQCTEALLLHFLASAKPHYTLFALEHLRLHKLFSPSAIQAVSAALCAGEREQVRSALAYLHEALPRAELLHAHLAHLIVSGSATARAYLLDNLMAQKSLPESFFETLARDAPNWQSYYELHIFLMMVEKSGYTSQLLIAQLLEILNNPNFLIARRAYWFLDKQPHPEAETAKRLQAFRERAAREGQIL